jgi:hypothetical protein
MKSTVGIKIDFQQQATSLSFFVSLFPLKYDTVADNFFPHTVAGSKSVLELGKSALTGGNSGTELGKSTAKGGNSNLELGKSILNGGNSITKLGNFTTNGGNSAPSKNKEKP